MTPAELAQMKLAWEADPVYHESYRNWIDFGIGDIETIVQAKFSREIKLAFSAGWINTCFNLCHRRTGKPARIDQIESVRRFICLRAGISPAAFQLEIESHYDSDFLRDYRYRIKAACREGGRSCVRPSHQSLMLVPSTRYPLGVGRSDSLRIHEL